MTYSRTLRTLVVDDNFYNRDVCILALNHVGFEVMEAENGRQALELLQHGKFDVILLDLAMPELDGVSVMKELQKLEYRDEMKVIVITAHSHMMTEMITHDADFVMYKPIDIEVFTQFLRRLKPT